MAIGASSAGSSLRPNRLQAWHNHACPLPRAGHEVKDTTVVEETAPMRRQKAVTKAGNLLKLRTAGAIPLRMSFEPGVADLTKILVDESRDLSLLLGGIIRDLAVHRSQINRAKHHMDPKQRTCLGRRPKKVWRGSVDGLVGEAAGITTTKATINPPEVVRMLRHESAHRQPLPNAIPGIKLVLREGTLRHICTNLFHSKFLCLSCPRKLWKSALYLICDGTA